MTTHDYKGRKITRKTHRRLDDNFDRVPSLRLVRLCADLSGPFDEAYLTSNPAEVTCARCLYVMGGNVNSNPDRMVPFSRRDLSRISRDIGQGPRNAPLPVPWEPGCCRLKPMEHQMPKETIETTNGSIACLHVEPGNRTRYVLVCVNVGTLPAGSLDSLGCHEHHWMVTLATEPSKLRSMYFEHGGVIALQDVEDRLGVNRTDAEEIARALGKRFHTQYH